MAMEHEAGVECGASGKAAGTVCDPSIETSASPHVEPANRGSWWRADDRPAPLGTDGKPMTVWQIWLKRLCFVVIAWAALELVIGVAFGIAGSLLEGVWVAGVELRTIAAAVGATALLGAVLNLAIGLLGIRGAKNPEKIALFFWITLADAVLTAWAMASNLSAGIIELTGIVSGLFIIVLAVCAWQVRSQTGYFDEHP